MAAPDSNPSILSGAFVRRARSGWHYRDIPMPDPRIKDVLLAHLAPRVRIVWDEDRNYVEIEPGEWEVQNLDAEVRRTLEAMMDEEAVGQEIAPAVWLPLDRPTHPRRGVLMPATRYRIPLSLWRLFFNELIGAEIARHELRAVTRIARHGGAA